MGSREWNGCSYGMLKLQGAAEHAVLHCWSGFTEDSVSAIPRELLVCGFLMSVPGVGTRVKRTSWYELGCVLLFLGKAL